MNVKDVEILLQLDGVINLNIVIVIIVFTEEFYRNMF